MPIVIKPTRKGRDVMGGGGMDIGKTKKKTKKKDPFRADRTTSLNREFSKRTAKANQEAMKNVKKKKDGGIMDIGKGAKSKKPMEMKSPKPRPMPKGRKRPTKPKSGMPFLAPKQKEMMDRLMGRGKPMTAKGGGSVRPIIKVDKDGKIRQTGKTRLKDGTIRVQPEGGMKFIRNKKGGGSLKPLPSAGENPGLRKLPTEVRNKMGYMKKGGKVMKMRGGGAATRGVNFKVM